MKNGFFRGHGLGNDYLVMDPKELSFTLTPAGSKRSATVTGGWAATASWPPSLRGKRISACASSIQTAAKRKNPATVFRIFARYLHATGRTRKTAFYRGDKRRPGDD